MKDGPYIDVWEESIIADAATVKAKFIAGELDILNTAQVTVDKLVADELAKSSGVKVAKGPANAHLIMQFDNFKWTDKRLRQAVWMAFDRDQFIRDIFLGDGLYGGPVADGFAKDGLALSQDELKKAQKFDAAEAKKLWDAAGGPQTFPSIKMITQQAIPLFATATQFIAEALRKNLGVDVKVEVVDPATYVAKAVGGYAEKKPKEWDLFVAWEQSLQSMPDYNALVHYIPTGYGAIFGNLRPDSPKPETAALATQMLQLWNAQAQELNVEARKQKMATLQKTILESYGPAVPLPVTATSYATLSRPGEELPGQRLHVRQFRDGLLPANTTCSWTARDSVGLPFLALSRGRAGLQLYRSGSQTNSRPPGRPRLALPARCERISSEDCSCSRLCCWASR